MLSNVSSVTRRLIALALEEDVGPGDITAQLVPADAIGAANIAARHDLVLAGSAAFTEVFRQVDEEVVVSFTAEDGDRIAEGCSFGTVTGPSRSILIGERTALNLLQRLCGVATYTRSAQDAVAGTKAAVVDTRKTTPGMRALEKQAVLAGGGRNHRLGLFDGVLIKDNHIAAVGGVKPAIEQARANVHHLVKIECEVTSLLEVDEALEAGADVIMLDNMDPATMRTAVEKIGDAALIEASGGITLENLHAVAVTGVDIISLGALTHSAKAADIGLDWT